LLLLAIFRKTDEEIITGKVFEYLASGKPILLIADGGYVADLILKLGRGTIIAHDDVEEIDRAIQHYYELHQKNNLPFARPISVPEFDRRAQAVKLAEVFQRLENS
jgi:glycosyltransferase involved in cell wall biosynthesis